MTPVSQICDVAFFCQGNFLSVLDLFFFCILFVCGFGFFPGLAKAVALSIGFDDMASMGRLNFQPPFISGEPKSFLP